MADTVLVVSLFAAAASMLGLGGFLLYVRFNSPVNRAFAVYLVVYAGSLALFALARISSGTSRLHLSRLQETFAIGAAGALMFFLVTYLAWRARGRWVFARTAVAVAALSVVALLAAKPCLSACLTDGTTYLGPLALLVAGQAVFMGVAALAMAIDWALRGPVPGHTAAFLLASAFAVNALFEGTKALVFGAALAGVAPNLWSTLIFPWRVAPVLLAGATLLVFVANARNLLRNPHLAAVVAASALAAGAGFYLGGQPAQAAGASFIGGLWRIVLAAVAAYALVRHRLFGTEVRLRKVLARALVLLSFLIVFFSVSAAVGGLAGRYAEMSGWIAAATLLLLLNPLDRLAQRAARSLWPTAGPVAALSPEERLAIYQERVGVLIADGGMGVMDRNLLDGLRDELQLPQEWAARLEREAWQLAAQKGSRGARVAPGAP